MGRSVAINEHLYASDRGDAIGDGVRKAVYLLLVADRADVVAINRRTKKR